MSRSSNRSFVTLSQINKMLQNMETVISYVKKKTDIKVRLWEIKN